MNYERPLLGCLLLDESCIETVKAFVKPEHFVSTDCSEVYRAICNLQAKGENTDILNVSEEANKDKYKTGPDVFHLISECYESCPSAINAESYAKHVLDAFNRREVQSIGDMASVADSGAEAVEQAIARLQTLSIGTEDTCVNINDALIGTISELEAIASGERVFCPTGLVDLDKKLHGFEDGRVYSVAGRPGMGKTAALCNMALAAVDAGYSTKVFTMEMPAEEITWRMICSRALLNVGAKYDMEDEHWPKVTTGFTMLKDKPLDIDYGSGYDIHYLSNHIRTYSVKNPKSIFFIDYLQMIRIEGKDAPREITEIMRQLKHLAKTCKVPIIVLNQLNRSCEQRPNKRPINSDLLGSGGIEQYSDVIMMLYRDEYYNEDSTDKGIAEIIVSKHRYGSTGTVRVSSQLQYNKFGNLAQEVYAK